MTTNRAAKQAARARAAATGETYASARRAISDSPRDGTDFELSRLLHRIRTSDEAWDQDDAQLALRLAGFDVDRASAVIAALLAACSSEAVTCTPHTIRHAGRSASGDALWAFGIEVDAAEADPQMGFWAREHLAPWLTRHTGVPTLVDPRAHGYGGAVLLGSRSDAELDPASGFDEAAVHDLERELAWHESWKHATGDDAVNSPRPQFQVTRTLRINGESVEYQPFVLLRGQSPSDYVTTEFERRMATAIEPAPRRFLAVCHFPDGRRGDRHPQAVAVLHSATRLPAPHALEARSRDALLVLTAQLGQACSELNLPRPEGVDATRTATGWAMTLRLFGGLTAQRMRQHAHELSAVLGSVVECTDGADPSVCKVTFQG